MEKTDINAASPAVVVALPGDTLTFVVSRELDSDEGQELLAQLQERFPGMDIGLISSCVGVIHESNTQ